jgi:Gpi16 subunit, GPI transamidase component
MPSLISKNSEIIIFHSDNIKTLVELKPNMLSEKFLYKDLILTESPISSERYISDLHFYKEGTFNHRIMNSNKQSVPIKVTTQDFFPKYLRPYLHQLKITFKDLETDKTSDSII